MFLLGIILRFTFIDNPNITGDEVTFLGFSYPTINSGIVTGAPSPPFQFLSQHHPPLISVNLFITLNIMNPNGWIFIEDWMVKFFPAVIGIISIIFVYIVVKKIYNETSGLIAALFFSICTFAVISSKVIFHDILLIPFVMITLLFAYQERWYLCGFFLGLCFLTKITAYTILPAILIYLVIRYLRIDKEHIKTFFTNFSKLAFIALLLYLPIIIYNIAIFIEYGFADTFYSRLFGLNDPITAVFGDPEVPFYSSPGLFNFAWIILPELVNVLSVPVTVYLIFCCFLCFFDKGEKLRFNIILLLFITTILFLFTYRWYQIVTLMVILVPITFISSRVSLILKKFKNSRVLSRKKKISKQTFKKFTVYGIILGIFGFNLYYTINTIAFNHSKIGMTDKTELYDFQFTYSNMGYLWIPDNGYDELFNLIKQYSNKTIYVDDLHPIFSYIYYFYLKDIKLLVSDWNNQTDSIFILYRTTNTIWEPMLGERDLVKDSYIRANTTSLKNLTNFLIYIN